MEKDPKAENHSFEVSEAEFEGSNGICLSCGEIQHGGVEPDARSYDCGTCGSAQVHGIEEALLMGRVTVHFRGNR